MQKQRTPGEEETIRQDTPPGSADALKVAAAKAKEASVQADGLVQQEKKWVRRCWCHDPECKGREYDFYDGRPTIKIEVT